jgi:hypothetical protein
VVVHSHVRAAHSEKERRDLSLSPFRSWARSGVGLVQRWQCGGGRHHADELGRRGLAVGVRGGGAGTGDGQTTTWWVGRGPILYKR